ncbi:hypothetical protein QBC41DRAFT_13107 [Cercophora samala]|uniref:DUF7587 domain-containing protein n=1 Tax=Cercophora samala TaxID=330535 RepID=A0AA40DF38_9PEZI|nr:hypothetical protein QBC41DRAFT_13107 [Cercophora samala]
MCLPQSPSVSTMESTRCLSKDLPPYLYRIQHRTTQTRYSESGGLEASDTTTLFGETSEKDAFKQAVENQFTWDFKHPTPFISFFSDKTHAINWGFCLKKWGPRSRTDDDWSILTIDTSCLQNTYVFKLSTVIDELDVKIPKTAEDAHKPGGYFCLHRVPACAIVCKKVGSLPRFQLHCKPLFHFSSSETLTN